MVVFQEIGKIVNNLMSGIQSSYIADKMNELSTILAIAITLTLVIKAIQILMGRVQQPMQELLWDIGVKLFIIGFVFFAPNYINAVGDLMNALFSWTGGVDGTFAKMDDLFGKVTNISAVIISKGSFLIKFLEAGAVMLSFGLAIIPAFIVTVTTKITLQILIIIAPLMIFLLSFGWAKNMFSNWLSLFFANLYTVLFVNLFFTILLDGIMKYYTTMGNKFATGNLLVLTAMMVFFSFIIDSFVNVAKELARQLATISLEATMRSSLGKMITKTGATTALTGIAGYKTGQIATQIGMSGAKKLGGSIKSLRRGNS